MVLITQLTFILLTVLLVVALILFIETEFEELEN